MNLKTYLKTRSQTELAKALGVTQGAVWQWANGLTSVAAERCPAIEAATFGMVRCEELRPDVAWSVLRQGSVTTDADCVNAKGAASNPKR